MSEHLIFFDGECPLCHRAVHQLIELDEKGEFIFAPLNGKTAARILVGPLEHYRHANSLVLLEQYQSTNRRFWIRSRAVLRTYWIIGGQWKLIGILSFFPGFLGDFFYRWLTEHRHQFKLKMPSAPGPAERFLD